MPLSQRNVYRWTSAVLASLRRALDELDFIEILPVILSERYEPGARHSIAVLGDHALPEISRTPSGNGPATVTVTGTHYYYLPVSHCVEKQLALEHAERVYCLAPCVRLLMDGETSTGRHLFTFFQVELEWRTADIEEVYQIVEDLLARLSRELASMLAATDLLTSRARERVELLAKSPFERVTFAQARHLAAGVGGNPNPHAAGDLSHTEERALSTRSNAPFWLTNYPDGARDSLYRRGPDGTFSTYDIVLPDGYGELATGGLRPDSAEDVLRQAHKFSDSPDLFYADWKRRTGLQTGGIGFGLERLIRFCADVPSVLDLRFAHDQGPNALIAA